jgi:hypothetical protein
MRAWDGDRSWVEQPVHSLEPRGDEVRVRGQSLAADLDAGDAARIAPGDTIRFGIPHAQEAYVL